MSPHSPIKSLKNQGFTLMEILVAVLIFAVLMVTVLSSFKAFVLSSDHIRTAISQDEIMGPPMDVLSRDLLSIHLSLPPAYTRPDTRSVPDPFRVVGDSDSVGGEVFSRLRFVSRGLLTAHGGEHHGLAQVIYYVRSNDTGGGDLCRSETLFPWEDGVENSCDPVLVKDIIIFELSYFDGDNDTFTLWDSDADAFDYATPRAVGVKIGFKIPRAPDDAPSTNILTTSIFLPVRRDALE